MVFKGAVIPNQVAFNAPASHKMIASIAIETTADGMLNEVGHHQFPSISEPLEGVSIL